MPQFSHPTPCVRIQTCDHGPGDWLPRGLPGSGIAVRTSVGVEPLQLVRINAAHHPRSEQALKEAADPVRAVPGRGDLHEGRAAPVA